MKKLAKIIYIVDAITSRVKLKYPLKRRKQKKSYQDIYSGKSMRPTLAYLVMNELIWDMFLYLTYWIDKIKNILKINMSNKLNKSKIVQNVSLIYTTH